MTPELGARLVEAWLRLPEEIRSSPASPDELAALERDLGPVPADYGWFLTNLGGGPVGSEWIDNVNEVRDSHQKFRDESDFWALERCFIIGWDGAGNPIVIEFDSGRVITEDHNFGGNHELGPSFEAFLADGRL